MESPLFPKELSEPHEYAFTMAGRHYWNFIDLFKTPSLRGLQSLVYYEELQKRTTAETYKEELDAEKIILRDVRLALSGQQGRINLATAFDSLGDLEKILNYREERLKFVVEPDILYKLASVVYFDETENPYRYDMKYNMEVKIPFWKANIGEEDFFLSKPIATLIPYLSEYKGTLPTHLTVTRMMRDIHLKHLSMIKSNLF